MIGRNGNVCEVCLQIRRTQNQLVAAPCCEPKLTQVEQRIMIKGYYVQVLKCPPEEEWWGEDGAVWTAVEALNVANYRTVESVFASLLEDPALDVSQRRSGSGGHNAKIKDGTTECDVLMGASGAGAGQRWTAYRSTWHRGALRSVKCGLLVRRIRSWRSITLTN